MLNKTHCCCLASLPLASLPSARTEDKSHFDRLKFKLAIEIEQMRGRGVTTFLTGMARGPELWAAEIILDLKRAYPDREIRLVAVVPYAGQPDHWPEPYRKRYFDVLRMADETIVLRAGYTPRCLLQCSRYMIENSAHMIAVTGGEQSNVKYAVAYAKKKKLDVVVVRPRE